jgi:PAS domain S-box-containing protein
MFTGFIRDITTRQAYEEERERLLELERVSRADADQSRGQLAAILSGVADAVTAQAPDGSLLFANETAVELLGFASLDELLAAPVAELSRRFHPLDEDGGPFPTERLPGRIALQEGRDAEAVIRFSDPRDGSDRWSRVKSTPVLGEDGEVAMAINVIEDVTELKRAEEAQRLLAESGRLLASSLDTNAILQRIANLMIAPWLADWCGVHVAGPEGRQPLVAWASSDSERGNAVAAIEEAQPPDPRDPAGVPGVIRTGEPELYPDGLPDRLDTLGPHSAVVAPIASRGRGLGAMTLVRLGAGRPYDPDDVALLEELGRRLGAWLHTAELYAERSYIAKTLQESLLPAQLPEIPGLATAARFRASGAGNEVGGDFYDLFPVGDGTWSVVVGDVCGKGPDAAAVTALVRYTLRAAAMSEPSPCGGLRILNEALLRQRDDLRFATVAYASIAPANGGAHVDVASAGHPLPLLLRADGAVEAVGIEGTLVGVVPDPDLHDAAARLESGDSLVFYTDGVTEARNENGVLGEARLGRIVASCAGMDADAIASAIEAAAVEMQPGGTRDDIAVVVLQAAGNVAKAAKNG